MELIVRSIPKNGKMTYPNNEDMYTYCCQYDGVEMVGRFKPAIKMTEKEKMIAYLYGPLMDTVIYGYYQQGWNGIDKVKAMYMQEAEFAKTFIVNEKTGERAVIVESVSQMTKERLLRFINDVIHFCEEDLQIKAPDSQEYKMMLLTGSRLKSVKFKK